MMIHKAVFTTLLGAAFASGAFAQPQPDAQQQMAAAVEAAKAALVRGPATVPLLDQAKLNLSAGFGFVPGKEARAVLAAMGNKPGEDTVGLILPGGSDWFVAMRYIKSGYIRDDEAKDWNADEMLEQIRSGTEPGNKERIARGIPALDIVGWIERPNYDAGTHKLKWSLAARDRGAPANVAQTINYNTYTLGREGFVSMNLVTNSNLIEGLKPTAAQLLEGLTFNDGKRYTDFDSTTDHVAEFGLAALIGGVAAKKLGLFALAAAFVAKFAKAIALAGFAVAAGVAKFFRRKRASVAAQTTVPSSPATPPPA
jgi:uncharacterized membrane-anchored protein